MINMRALTGPEHLPPGENGLKKLYNQFNNLKLQQRDKMPDPPENLHVF